MAVICSGLLMGSAIFAQETVITDTATQEITTDENVSSQDLEVKNPKFLPDSPFYFLKEWVRKIKSTFTFNKVKKAELENKYANEKLIELKKIVEKNASAEKIVKAIENYQKQIEKIKTQVDKINETADKSEKVNNFLDKFVKQQVLQENILQKLETQVPPEVFQKIKEARENHLEKFQEVMQKLENREEKQLEITENLRQELGQKPEIAEKIKESKENILEKIQEKNQKINCPATLVPDCSKEKARLIVKKDEKGCIILDCVEIEKPEKPEKPGACITLWDPVCGVDGKTYSNSCFAGLAGVDVAYKGVCKGVCGNGICEEGEADICPFCPSGQLVCSLAPCTQGTCPQDCTQELNTPECTDSDGGKNYYEKGYANPNCPKGATCGAWFDYCIDSIDSKTLLEYFCKSGKIESERIACPNGCYEGVCIQRTTIPTSQQQCLAQGGVWDYFGMRPEKSCNFKTSDVSKSCTDSDQCEGKCLGQENITTGQCSEWITIYGCHAYIEQGQAGPTLCAD